MRLTTSARFAASALAFLAVLGASSADSVVPTRHRPITHTPAGGAHLVAFGSRGDLAALGAGGRKLDGTLADLAQHSRLVRPAMSDLRSLNPAARFALGASGEPLVLIDATTRGDPRQLEVALVALGLVHPAHYSNDVSGWLPVSRIATAAARAEVHAMRAALPRARAVSSQGDFAQGSSAIRTQWTTLDGTGVSVGVLSDSYDCYAIYQQPGSGVPASGYNGYAFNGFTADAAKDISTGDLPQSVNVLEEAGQGTTQGTCMDFNPPPPAQPTLLPYGDEGRAMLQIAHHVAPGASLAFHTAVEGEADFASGIAALAAAGAKVIADDVGYFDEPFFQPSLVGEAIDQVNSQGIAYFTAAGNDGQLAYDNTAPSFAPRSGSAPNPAGELLLNFDSSGVTTTQSLPVTIAGLLPGEFVGIVVQWDQPYHTGTGTPGSAGASSRIDLCVTKSGTGTDTITDVDGNAATCTQPNATGVDPVQILIIGNPATATTPTNPEQVSITIGLAGGTAAPGRIKLAVEDDGAGSTIDKYYTPSPTVQGHAGTAGAATLGAAFFPQTPLCGTSPAVVETYTSAGGDPILFDASGKRLATPITRQKPDFVGPDGVNDTFLGFTLASANPPIVDGSSVPQCANDASFPNFFGTSSATPHAAGVAALMLQANPAITPTQIYGALRSSAQPMTGSPASQVGAGFIQADAALATLPAGPPILKLSPSTIYLSQSSTLSWLAVNSTSCTAMGWNGNPSPNGGSQVVTPAATGTYTYTLTCTSAAGSQNASATLTVQAVPALSITSSSLPSGTVGTAYSASLAASGGIAPYTWSITSGTLPAGLSLNASTGAITGTPTAATSSMALTFQVTDSEKSAQSKATTLSLTIAAAPSSGGGGGGGGLDGLTMLVLAGLGCAALVQRIHRGPPLTVSGPPLTVSGPPLTVSGLRH